MTKSEQIRTLAKEGLCVSDIAARLGIRYQHAYNVLKVRGSPPKPRIKRATVVVTSNRAVLVPKPPLSVDELLGGGFEFSGRWVLSGAGDLTLDRPLSKAVGAYAFAKEGIVLHVGVATIGLAKRLYFYGKPGITQPTNLRLSGIIKNELSTAPFIEIYTATPPDLEWNGLPIHGTAGLELGLIKKFALPWNMRSSA